MRVIVFVAVLAIVAALSPTPWHATDRDEYERVGRELLIPGCSSLHCFRKLVPIVLEHVPGPSLLKWKVYAVLSNAFAALAVHRLALLFGLTGHAAAIASSLTLLGFGSLYTLYDPHTADPLMFLLGPALTILLLGQREGRAASVAAVGVFAKEFAAAPLWMAAWAAGLGRRWGPMVRAGIAALSVTTLWIVFQLVLITAFDYSYGENPSSRIFEGGYIVHWVQELGLRAAIIALVATYGALYLLVPAGFAFATPPLRHWAIASIPALLMFGYVQQTDRAIWNFHFLATPLAALVLTRLAPAVAWGFVAAYAAANLRIGAQLPWVPGARFFLAISTAIALVALVAAWRQRTSGSISQEAIAVSSPPLDGRARRRVVTLAAANAVVLLIAGLVMLDGLLHRRVERVGGVNKWGYRGPVLPPKRPGEVRVAVLGGEIAFGSAVNWDQSMPYFLGRNMGQRWRALHLVAPVSIANLASPRDAVTDLPGTLADFAFLHPDIVALVTDLDGAPGPEHRGGWRRQSALFRATGYVPELTRAMWEPATPDGVADTKTFCDAVGTTVEKALALNSRVLVVAAPSRTPSDRERQAVLGQRLADRFANNRRVAYVDLSSAVDLRDPGVSADGVRLTAHGNDVIAERLTDRVLDLTRQ